MLGNIFIPNIVPTLSLKGLYFQTVLRNLRKYTYLLFSTFGRTIYQPSVNLLNQARAI